MAERPAYSVQYRDHGTREWSVVPVAGLAEATDVAETTRQVITDPQPREVCVARTAEPFPKATNPTRSPHPEALVAWIDTTGIWRHPRPAPADRG